MIHVYCKKIIVSYCSLLFIFPRFHHPSQHGSWTVTEILFFHPQMAVLPSKIITLSSSGREMCAGLWLAYVPCFFVSGEICYKFSRNKTRAIRMGLLVQVWHSSHLLWEAPTRSQPIHMKWRLGMRVGISAELFFILNMRFLISSRWTREEIREMANLALKGAAKEDHV